MVLYVDFKELQYSLKCKYIVQTEIHKNHTFAIAIGRTSEHNTTTLTSIQTRIYNDLDFKALDLNF